jgi:dynein heavy chain 1
VEIIGNSNEPAKILVHLGKMFAAITGLRTNLASDGETNQLLAISMLSKEGESVDLNSTINLNTGVKEWLGDLHFQMSGTLGSLIDKAWQELSSMISVDLLPWIQKYPAQICILVTQLAWTKASEDALRDRDIKRLLSSTLRLLNDRLHSLSLAVLQNMEADVRQKTEQLLTEMVHQRDISRSLIAKEVNNCNDFEWLYHLRFYWNPKEQDLVNRLQIRMSNAIFHYGFEYLGVGERLVQTPLTDRCYLTLTQALHFRMGGNPFGPAGTGNVSSVLFIVSRANRFCFSQVKPKV